MSNLIARFAKDESGATAIEYGLIAALIAVAIIAGAGAVGRNAALTFGHVASTLADTQTTAAPATP